MHTFAKLPKASPRIKINIPIENILKEQEK